VVEVKRTFINADDGVEQASGSRSTKRGRPWGEEGIGSCSSFATGTGNALVAYQIVERGGTSRGPLLNAAVSWML